MRITIWLRASLESSLRQREHYQRIRRRNRHVLLSVPALIGHRNRRRGTVEFACPELFAGFGIECAEARIGGRAHEHQASGGYDGAPAGTRPRVPLALRQS